MQKSYQANAPRHDNKRRNKQTKKVLGHNKGSYVKQYSLCKVKINIKTKRAFCYKASRRISQFSHQMHIMCLMKPINNLIDANFAVINYKTQRLRPTFPTKYTTNENLYSSKI
jgi:hypothetical protein